MPLLPRNANEADYVGGKKHFADVIKNRSANDTLIFKNPEEDFNNGSTLVVEPGEQAIFINQGNVEQVFDAGSYKLETQNYPFISRLRNTLSGGISTFHCLVYFVRTAISREILWGTETPLKVYDHVMVNPITGLGLETQVRSHGSYQVNVKDAGVFLTQLIGGNYTLDSQESLNEFFRSRFTSYITQSLNKALNAMQEPLNMAMSYAMDFSATVCAQIEPALADYGLHLVNFNIAVIDPVDTTERQRQAEMALDAQGEIFGAQAQALRYQALGTNFQEAQSFNVLHDAARNPGSSASGMMGAGMGLAMGAGIGGAVGNIFGQTMQLPQQQMPQQPMAAAPQPMPAAPQTVAPQPAPAAPAAPVDHMARLNQAKQLHDAGLITDEQFEAKQAEILKEL